MNKLPMKLQFFADDSETPEAPETPETPETQEKDEKDLATQLREANEKLQAVMTDNVKLKRSNDKLSHEAAENKRKYRETLSEQEQAQITKAEEQAKHDEEFAAMKRQLSIRDLAENFMDLGYSKDLAKKAAEAQTDGDTETLLSIQKQFNESLKKSWETEFLKSRPEINVGSGTGEVLTKEKFDAMTLAEKSKLKRENEPEYRRLIAL